MRNAERYNKVCPAAIAIHSLVIGTGMRQNKKKSKKLIQYRKAKIKVEKRKEGGCQGVEGVRSLAFPFPKIVQPFISTNTCANALLYFACG